MEGWVLQVLVSSLSVVGALEGWVRLAERVLGVCFLEGCSALEGWGVGGCVWVDT